MACGRSRVQIPPGPLNLLNIFCELSGIRQKDLNVRSLYIMAALAMGLTLFALAEALVSPALMILASLMVVLSAIALGAIMPTKILSLCLSKGRNPA